MTSGAREYPPPLGGLVRGFVMQTHQLPGLECDHGVGSAGVIAELDFIDPWCPTLDDGADLAADQSLFGQVLEQCNHGKHFNVCHGEPFSYST